MEATTKKKKFQFPDVYALIFILCCLAMVLTWIIPAGTFERVTEGTLTKVVAGTFQHVDSSPQTPWAMLQAIYQGFINSAGTIFLIFFCGASVAMVEESHALSDFFTWLARKLKGKEMLAIAILMYGLGLGNAAGAFANIGVALMPIGIVMSNAIGGDAFLAFLIIYYGLQSGFSIGFANPSILGVAQTMAEIPIFSGTNVRVVCCLANITFLYIVTMLYYRRIRKDPTKSLNYGSDFHSAFEISSDKVDSKMTKRQILTAAVFLLGVVLCVGLTIACKWNAKKIASYFFGMMIVIGLVSGFSMNEISDKFIKGCKPMIYASFITGLASAIAVILNQGKVLDTIRLRPEHPAESGGCRGGCRPDGGRQCYRQHLYPLRFRSGSGHDPADDPHCRSGRHYPSGRRAGLPVWRRPVQPAHPAERTHDGLPGHGRHQLPQVHQVGIQVPDDEHRRCHRDHHGAAGCGLGRFLIPV